jgi:hypothetical protein
MECARVLISEEVEGNLKLNWSNKRDWCLFKMFVIIYYYLSIEQSQRPFVFTNTVIAVVSPVTERRGGLELEA